ncbi:hypothetical protein [Gloeocapsopsis dulcis]|uniref:Uncharacterized protein n=1 Tax=Gloeocapsopsis dulcis AAB1 = 1H9 TaxID=1433147 RepID=A0A6N8FUS0_9CHRO|nr:hypothetical protein [Gloeocapsopsis dulcis]MUL36524.1 hypothetical protein [Gloeocapsopsis dulcis AAB1 = 1H9]WNN87809.1 hypothetical protein P0S91_16000 [Gloeocapsopsis dulcis]
MTTLITPKTQALLDSLKSSQLVQVSFEPTKLWVSLEFTFGPEGKNVVVELQQLVHFVLSKEDPDDDGCFFVGEVTMTTVENSATEILSSLSYLFRIQNKNVQPEQSLLHFHLEGAVCIEAICRADLLQKLVIESETSD